MVGAVFVILDFVDYELFGGAIGAVRVAVGVAAGLAVTVPPGRILGRAIAFFVYQYILFTWSYRFFL